MNPLLCRHGVALALNMAFMFSSEEFNMEMNKYEGLLKDNGGNPINLDALRQRIRNHGGLVLGCVAGVGGLGGGNTYGLANYCYTGVYLMRLLRMPIRIIIPVRPCFMNTGIALGITIAVR